MSDDADRSTDRFSGVSSTAVAAKTGKGWDEWFAILDDAGAQQMAHPQIARYLAEQHGVPDWWCQTVTVGYEQARGLRQVHEQADGFTANASKTLPVPVERLFRAWAEDVERGQWLPGAVLTVRKATPGKSLRISWGDGTNVDVELVAKGTAKSQVSVQHSRLADAEDAAEMKTYWQAGLARLETYLAANARSDQS